MSTNGTQRTKDLDDIKDAKVRRKIRDLAMSQREIQEQIAALEAAKKSNNEELLPLVKSLRLDKITSDLGWQILRTVTKRSTIKKELLLTKGVHMDIIDECTEVKETESLSVRSASQAGG